jgi:hypothetical protein
MAEKSIERFILMLLILWLYLSVVFLISIV